MVIRAAAEFPVKLPFGITNRQIVDAGEALAHQAGVIEHPVLVAIGTIPLPGPVVEFIRVANGNPVFGEGEQFLDQTIVQLPPPLRGEEADNLCPSSDEQVPVSPGTVFRLGQGDLLGIAAIPAIFGKAHLLGGRFMGKGRQWGTHKGLQ